METARVLGPAAAELVKELDRQLTVHTGDKRETVWLAQRVSVAAARGKAVSVLATVKHTDRTRRQVLCQTSRPFGI